MKGKKALVWNEIGRWIIIGLLIIALLVIVGLMTGGLKDLWSSLQDIFTFS